MFRLNLFFIYENGVKIQALRELKVISYPSKPGKGSSINLNHFVHNWARLSDAKAALDNLLHAGVFGLSIRGPAYSEFQKVLTETLDKVSTTGTSPAEDLNKTDSDGLLRALDKFEAVLQGDLSTGNFYAVLPKGAYDTTTLTTDGVKALPAGLELKCPGTEFDANEAAKCLAFELWTACAFHLYRIVEAVLAKYWSQVSNGAEHPDNRAMGKYLQLMENTPKDQPALGSPEVRAALRDMKNLHRNPLIHPEKTINSEDEAIALLHAVYSVVNHMLTEIDVPAVPETNTLAGLLDIPDTP
ncbi:MAG: hypothetical protein ACRBBO_06910 [Cognatishimia sp.]